MKIQSYDLDINWHDWFIIRFQLYKGKDARFPFPLQMATNKNTKKGRALRIAYYINGCRIYVDIMTRENIHHLLASPFIQ